MKPRNKNYEASVEKKKTLLLTLEIITAALTLLTITFSFALKIYSADVNKGMRRYYDIEKSLIDRMYKENEKHQKKNVSVLNQVVNMVNTHSVQIDSLWNNPVKITVPVNNGLFTQGCTFKNCEHSIESTNIYSK
jgi:hypothetical protein